MSNSVNDLLNSLIDSEDKEDLIHFTVEENDLFDVLMGRCPPSSEIEIM